VVSSAPMKLCRLVFARSTAILVLCLSVMVVSVLPVGCSSTAGPGGTGGAKGSGGSIGSGGSTGSGTGGSSAADAGSDVRAPGTGGRAATDAGSSGAGGTIVMVDAAGNTLTCADLLACCNRVTDATAMALCLQQYNNLRTQGNAACGNLLTQIRANGGCP